jgi:hypothetical protein
LGQKLKYDFHFHLQKCEALIENLRAAETLLAVNPFNSDAICLSIDPCWDTSFCSGPNQIGWHGSPFRFTATTHVQFPSVPIHCPTVEKFGAGHTKKGYLIFNYNMHSNDAWSVGVFFSVPQGAGCNGK